jgi:hypothetical protein
MTFGKSEPLFFGLDSVADYESGISGTAGSTNASGFTGFTGTIGNGCTGTADFTRTMGSSAVRNVPPKQAKQETKESEPMIISIFQMSLNEQVTAIVAGFIILLSLATIVIEGTFFAILSGLLSIVMGSYAHYQQTQLTKVAIMRERSDMLQKEIARLGGDNTKLTYFADEMEGRVEDLLDVEDALEIISEGQSVNALQKHTDANLLAVCKIQKSVEMGVIETLISSIFSRENDAEIDAPITDAESTKMMKKLKGIVGLSVNERRLQQTVVGNSIESIIDALQNLLDEDIPARNRIFQVK